MYFLINYIKGVKAHAPATTGQGSSTTFTVLVTSVAAFPAASDTL